MFKKEITRYQEDMIKSIAKLVRHESVRDISTSRDFAPFGKNIRGVMDEFMEIASKLGFKVEDHDGYAISATLGNQKKHLGILGHLDVVGIHDLKEWNSEPFVMDIRSGYMYGRGVNDDKGPLIAALYAAKIVYETKERLNRSIKIIAGGAEETTWECMDYYFKYNPQPDVGFSPDGNFPIVNGEMGILQVQLTFNEQTKFNFHSKPLTNYLCYRLDVNDNYYEGDKHLSRNPQRGRNAIFEFIRSYEYDKNFKSSNLYKFISKFLFDDIEAYNLGLATTHEEMLPLSVCAMSLNSVGQNEVLNLDFRYPVNISKEKIMKVLVNLSQEYNYNIDIIKQLDPLYISKNSKLIKGLNKAYEKVTSQSTPPLTKGGASYARVLDCGVAFGATFEGEDPRPHMSNEKMSISSLLRACEIYCHAIFELTK